MPIFAGLDIVPGNNVVSSVVQWINAAGPGYGADQTGATDSTAAIQAAVTACINAGGGIVYLPKGTYKTLSTITATIPTGAMSVMLLGDGLEATFIRFAGTGDAIRMLSPNWTGRQYSQGSGMTGITVDGTSAGAASAGFHVGDISGLKVDAQFPNFSGAGSIGLWFENTVTWTEQADVRAYLANCTTGVKYSFSGTGTGSYQGGRFDYTMWQTGGTATGGQDGVNFSGGVDVYHAAAFRMRGNFNSSSTALTNTPLRFSGGSTLEGNVLIQVECNAGANLPTTIIADSLSSIEGTGILDFSFGGQAINPSNLNPGQIVGAFLVSGDTSILPGAAYDLYQFGTPSTPQTLLTQDGLHGGGFPTTTSDMFTHTLSASITANLTSSFYNGNKTLGVPQRITVVIKQAAAGGPYTVTWPHPGSPTTSAPTVKWAGGTAPVMTAAASATDVYKLETTDGVTWYGQASQNLS